MKRVPSLLANVRKKDHASMELQSSFFFFFGLTVHSPTTHHMLLEFSLYLLLKFEQMRVPWESKEGSSILGLLLLVCTSSWLRCYFTPLWVVPPIHFPRTQLLFESSVTKTFWCTTLRVFLGLCFSPICQGPNQKWSPTRYSICSLTLWGPLGPILDKCGPFHTLISL